MGAFRAWMSLADSLGESAMPHLVCVGGRGWLNDDLHRMLRDNPGLQRLVRILHGVPDDGLAALYENCLFALYPSFYEGWGLPVSEPYPTAKFRRFQVFPLYRRLGGLSLAISILMMPPKSRPPCAHCWTRKRDLVLREQFGRATRLEAGSKLQPS
ncbi:hypothetical protein [Sphingobium fuliginis]|uniref:hypothetical protein n=1 Tax=Sphingobium fuliginis (strain ATCC 27551) TaxID=336203 RepID=UPI003570B231